MQALGLGWEEVDAVVISHPHPDHLGGLGAFQDRTIFFGAPPGEVGRPPTYAPVPLSYEDAPIIHSQVPTLIAPDLATTGAIAYSEVFPIYLFAPKGYEQGLVVNVAGEGSVLITGCGHPTLERLVSRVETLYGLPVIGVVGGLHYEAASAEAVQPHIEFLAARQPKLVALSPHDSSPEARQAFQAAFPEAYRNILVGETIQYP
jgi:7,8-dihydropterin-6-yl-methyl-4-(beta-D-ribofuranosyl)aminobenzene 5'-phosphate synthase